VFNRPRQIPQVAKYKLARMHDALEAVGKATETARNLLVLHLGAEQTNEAGQSLGWGIPKERQKEYDDQWDAIRAEDVTVRVTPLRLSELGDSAQGIEAHEFKMLGSLIDAPVDIVAEE